MVGPVLFLTRAAAVGGLSARGTVLGAVGCTGGIGTSSCHLDREIVGFFVCSLVVLCVM